MSDVEICGWLGAVLVLLAYYFNTTEILKTKSLSYQLINIVGATLLIYYTYHRGAFASMAVNLIWTFIGLCSLKGIVLKDKRVNRFSSLKVKKNKLL